MKTWFKMTSKIEPEPRRNHCAVAVGNTMLVYGGVNNNNECMNDLWTFKPLKKEWVSHVVYCQ